MAHGPCPFLLLVLVLVLVLVLASALGPYPSSLTSSSPTFLAAYLQTPPAWTWTRLRAAVPGAWRDYRASWSTFAAGRVKAQADQAAELAKQREALGSIGTLRRTTLMVQDGARG